jgi:hypothetical protein
MDFSCRQMLLLLLHENVRVHSKSKIRRKSVTLGNFSWSLEISFGNENIQKMSKIWAYHTLWLTYEYVFTYPWLYGPLRILASCSTDAHSSQLFYFCLHFFTSIPRKSFSTSSSHLSLGLPTSRLTSDLKIVLAILSVRFRSDAPNAPVPFFQYLLAYLGVHAITSFRD